MHIALTEDQTLLQDSLDRILREHSTGTRIRAAEPGGFDRALWDVLVGQGVPMLRVPEAAGGSDASLMHAVVAAECAGRHVAGAPIAEAMAANRLLASLGGKAKDLLAECLEGGAIATLALHDAGRVTSQRVPGAAGASHVLACSGESVRLLSAWPADDSVEHGATGSAQVDLARAKVVATFDGARASFEAALEEWRLLNAARVVAAGRRAVEIAAEYACEREAFGRKIGEYQGVSHALADAVTDLDGGRLLVWRSADRIARKASSAAASIAMAAWWAGKVSRESSLKAMRVFGGYGMAMEYDAQLYWRKANAWSLLEGNPDRLLDDIAARALDGKAGALPATSDVGVDFEWGADAKEAAERMRRIVQSMDVQKTERFMRDSLDGFDRDLYKRLAKEGLLYPDFPKEIGGGGLSPSAASAVYEVQCGDYGWHVLAPGATDMIAKIVYHFGSEEAKAEIMPKVMSGESYCSLGYTEPSNGSDIFAVKTAARRESDASGADWIINGQKMFTSVGHLGDYSLMITRTGPDKYKGVTVFIAPLRQPGYEFTEIKTIGGERTNVTFYRDIRVPDRYRVGEVGGGVKVMAAALTLEQSGGDTYLYGLRNLYKEALAWAKAPNPLHDGRRPIESESIRRLFAEVATQMEVGDALYRHVVYRFETGTVQKWNGPMSKLFNSEMFLKCSQRLLAALAPDSLTVGYERAGVAEWLARRSIPGTIYGGTSEVQRSLVAESALKLPRTRG